ncbi:MAG: site-specific integrase, partial [Chloroflexi bacterium]|nr:site-specific integrase [Chloroflexota bacterium]
MSGVKKEQWLRVVSQSELARDITAFLTDRRARGHSPGTLHFYCYKLGHLRNYLESRGIRNVQDITPSVLRQWLLDLGKSHNPGGVHQHYRAAKAFLRWCWVEYDLDIPNPIVKVVAPKLPQEPLDPVPMSDVKRMLATCERRTFTGDRDRAIMLCLLDSGARA